MASIYTKKESKYFWIRYKGEDGKWKGQKTPYLKGNHRANLGNVKQAELLARDKTLEEMARKPVVAGRSAFSEWVIPWIETKWGHKQTCTPKYYRRYLLRWLEYFDEIGVATPSAVTREIVQGYMLWRARHGGERNTAIDEIKFFAQVMEEALQRGYVQTNCARKLGLSRAEQKHKTPWTEEEIALVGSELAKAEEFGWMHVTFLMGLYQAIRLRQCAIELRDIDLRRQLFNYPDYLVKKDGTGRGRGYSQPIDPDFLPLLRAIVNTRRTEGATTLCDIPGDNAIPPSVQWRKFLDTLNLPHISHHGLRASFITRAALAGVPEAQTRRFVNHSSQQVHEIYQRITAGDLFPIFGMMDRGPKPEARLSNV
jgi:integrase